MAVVTLLARLVLAAVFVVSAAGKIRSGGTREAARDLGLPGPLATVSSAALPWVELGTAAGLATGGRVGYAAGLVAAVTLLAFTALLAVNLALGRHPACHCFGERSAAPLTWAALVRNAGLLALAGVAIRAGPGQPWGVGALRHSSAAGVGIGALAAAVAVLGGLFYTVLRRYGALLLRVEDLEAAARGEDTRPVAPDFDLPDLGTGGRARLADLTARGQPALLVFASTSCVPCQQLVPELAAWTARLPVAVVTAGPAAAARDKFAGHPSLRVLHDDARVAAAYGTDATPAAVLVAADGRVGGGPAYGADAIRALVRPYLPAAPALTIEPRPLGAGDPAPAVTLAGEDGAPVDPARLDADACTRALLFWDPECGFAQRITADVTAWEAAHGDRLVLVTKGDPAAVRASGLRSRLVPDPAFAAGRAYGAPGTPSAVAVRDGRLASAVAAGGPEVLALLERVGSDTSEAPDANL